MALPELQLVKLKAMDDSHVYVNPLHVLYVKRSSTQETRYTEIFLVGLDVVLMVQETPALVLTKLNAVVTP